MDSRSRPLKAASSGMMGLANLGSKSRRDFCEARLKGVSTFYQRELFFCLFIHGKLAELNLAEKKFMDEIFVLYRIRGAYEEWNHETLNSPEVTVMQGSLV